MRSRPPLIGLFLLLFIGSTRSSDLELDVVLPDKAVNSSAVQAQRGSRDAFVCTTLKLPEKSYKLVGVHPMAKADVVKQVLLYGRPYQLTLQHLPATAALPACRLPHVHL